MKISKGHFLVICIIGILLSVAVLYELISFQLIGPDSVWDIPNLAELKKTYDAADSSTSFDVEGVRMLVGQFSWQAHMYARLACITGPLAVFCLLLCSVMLIKNLLTRGWRLRFFAGAKKRVSA